MGFILFSLLIVFFMGIILGMFLHDEFKKDKWVVTVKDSEFHVRMLTSNFFSSTTRGKYDDLITFRFYVPALIYYWLLKNKHKFEK